MSTDANVDVMERGCGVYDFILLSNGLTLVACHEKQDYYVVVSPGDDVDVELLNADLLPWGLEVMDPGECEPELHEDGLRFWCVLKDGGVE